MDIHKLLTSSDDSIIQEEEKESMGEGRDILYKRRGINFSGNNKENRALRQIRVSVGRSCSVWNYIF